MEPSFDPISVMFLGIMLLFVVVWRGAVAQRARVRRVGAPRSPIVLSVGVRGRAGAVLCVCSRGVHYLQVWRRPAVGER